VLHQVGAGVLGPVFRALDPDQERMVGIKLFRLDMPPEQAGRLAEQLTAVVERLPPHEGLVRPIAAGLDGATAYLVTDYVAADSIDQRLRRRMPTPLDQVMPLVEQLAAALDAAAGAGFYHGALHPRDVLVSTTGSISLTGIGVTQALEAVAWRPPFRRPYAAPERVAGRPWHAAADVFSLAVLAVELASGRRPLMPENSPTLPALGIEDESRAEAVRRVLANALDEDPDLRDRSAAHWAFRLSEAARGPAVGERLVPAAAAVVVDDLPLQLAGSGEPGASGEPRDPAGAEGQTPVEQTTHAGHSEAESLERLKAAASRLPETPGVEDSWSRLVAAGKRVSSTTESVPVASIPALPRADTGAPPLRPRRDPSRESAETPAPLVPPRARPAGPLLAAVGLACLALGFGAGYWTARQSPPPAPVEPAVAAPVSPPAAGPTPAVRQTPPARDTARPPAPAPRPRTPPRQPTAATPRPTAPTEATAMREGRILVRSTPAATVRVNGTVRGKTPLALRELAFGSYRISVEAPGYQPAEREVAISASQPSGTVTFDLVVAGATAAPTSPRADIATSPATGRTASQTEASLDLVSSPSGARAFVDDRLVGTTPVRVSGLTPGAHTVRLEHGGYGPWTGSVTTVAGRVTRVSVTLEPSR
jgi:serine/threonine-protein kinase